MSSARVDPMIAKRNARRPRYGLLALVAILVSACGVAPPSFPTQPEMNPADAMSRAMDSVRDRFTGNVQSQTTQTNDGVQVVMQSGHAQDISQTAMSSDGR